MAGAAVMVKPSMVQLMPMARKLRVLLKKEGFGLVVESAPGAAGGRVSYDDVCRLPRVLRTRVQGLLVEEYGL